MDFWEAILITSSQEAVIQELLFRLASVYIDRLTNSDVQPGSLPSASRRRPLRNAEDLVKQLKTFPSIPSVFLIRLNLFVTTMFVF